MEEDSEDMGEGDMLMKLREVWREWLSIAVTKETELSSTQRGPKGGLLDNWVDELVV